MPLFVKFAYWEAVLLFGGFLGVVLWKLLTGRSLGATCSTATFATQTVRMVSLPRPAQGGRRHW